MTEPTATAATGPAQSQWYVDPGGLLDDADGGGVEYGPFPSEEAALAFIEDRNLSYHWEPRLRDDNA